MEQPQDSWRLVEHVLLRRAGFPFALMSSLASSGTAARALEVIEAEEEADSRRDHLLHALFPAEVSDARERGDRVTLRNLSRWRRSIGQRRLVVRMVPTQWSNQLLAGYHEWVDAVRNLESARHRVAQTMDAEGLITRQALRLLIGRPGVREALFLLAPGIIDAIARQFSHELAPKTSSHEHALERRLYGFIQRLAAKNETHSFFGPLTYGVIDEKVERIAPGPETQTGVVRCEAFAAFWAVSALAQLASADASIRRELPIRRIAASAVLDGIAHCPDGTRIALDLTAISVFESVNDARRVTDISTILALPLDMVELLVSQLERLSLVRRDLEIRSTTAYPLTDFVGQLPPVPAAAKWRKLSNQFEGYLRSFEDADLASRRDILRQAEMLFQVTTGKSPRRAAGRMYADRTILYEDCLGDLTPLRIPSTEAYHLAESLAPVLDIGLTLGLRRYAAVRQLAAELFDKFNAKTPLLQFAESFDASVKAGRLASLLDSCQNYVQSYSECVKAATHGNVACLHPSILTDLVSVQDGAYFTSPDVMLYVRPDGGLRYVIGEVHPYVFAWGSQNHFAPNYYNLQAAFREDLSPWGGAERMATVVRRRRHKGLLSETFPGRFIDVTGRSSNDPRRRIAIADLYVVRGHDGPILQGPNGQVILYVGEDEHPHLRAFAPPQVEMPTVRLGRHTPRIEMGHVVIQRERWDIPVNGIPEIAKATTPLELTVAIAKARRSEGWPRYVFLHSPVEPKPICLDLEVIYAQEYLARFLRMGDIALTEMLPAPHDLWLHRSDGSYTSELRIALIRSPHTSAPPERKGGTS